MRLLEQLFDTRNGCVEHVGNVFRAFVFIGAAFRDFKDAGLGEIEQILTGAPLRIKTRIRNFMGDGNHVAHHRTFANNIRIGADVRGTWRIFGEFSQIRKTADAVQLPLSLQRFRERNQVYRTAGFLQPPHFCEDVTMWTGIKIFRYHALGDIVPALVIQH